jgi:putative ABC transport system permease protein
MFQMIRTIRLALKSLMLHKLRSGLTMLGIVFGVFSVIAMLAIGEGASAQAQKQVLELGATNIIVTSVKPPQEANDDAGSRVLDYGLYRSDFDLLTSNIPTITKGIPIREVAQEFRYLEKTIHGRLAGCTADYLDVNHLEMARGRFLNENDQKYLLNVAVIASEVAEMLFQYNDPVGKSVQFGSSYYKIIGVTKRRTASAAIGGSLSGQDYNKDVYIPLKTFQVRIGDVIFLRQAGSFSGEKIELNQITLQVRSKEDVIPTAEVIRETLEQTHGKKQDYAVVVPLELLKQADQLRLIFNVVLGSIAAISLIVGGIGIMNIMLATVTERTREIGIRRALGARQRDIIVQFLIETIVLSGTGGVIGVFMGLMTPYTFIGIKLFVDKFILTNSKGVSEVGRIFTEMEPQVAYWSLPLAFGISVGIGILFGIYPARSAAKMDPIEALRHE